MNALISGTGASVATHALHGYTEAVGYLREALAFCRSAGYVAEEAWVAFDLGCLLAREPETIGEAKALVGGARMLARRLEMTLSKSGQTVCSIRGPARPLDRLVLDHLGYIDLLLNNAAAVRPIGPRRAVHRFTSSTFLLLGLAITCPVKKGNAIPLPSPPGIATNKAMDAGELSVRVNSVGIRPCPALAFWIESESSAANPTTIVGRTYIEPCQVLAVDAGEPDEIIANFGDEHLATADVLASRVCCKRNESTCIERSTQLVGARSIMHSTDVGPIVGLVIPDGVAHDAIHVLNMWPGRQLLA